MSAFSINKITRIQQSNTQVHVFIIPINISLSITLTNLNFHRVGNHTHNTTYMSIDTTPHTWVP